MKAEINGTTVNLPDFLIVGAARSGTTSLYHYLKEHPQIFMPDIKEPRFFAFGDIQPNYRESFDVTVWRFKDYLDLFEGAGEGMLLGEASPVYLLYYEETIYNIKKYVPSWQDVKIIMILRDPVERILSQYYVLKMQGIEPLELEDALQKEKERMEEGWSFQFHYSRFYHNQVKAYLDNFPLAKVYLYEDLKSNALGLVKDIYKFLGVDDSFVPEIGRKHNVSKDPFSKSLHRILKKNYIVSSIFPPIKLIPYETRVSLTKKLKRLNIRKDRRAMKEETRQRLKLLYREDILRLQELIGRDLSGWLK
jgi:hypothetical protein